MAVAEARAVAVVADGALVADAMFQPPLSEFS